MKRSILFFFFFAALMSLINAQSPTVFISGTITSIANGSPISNHEVIITSDSSSGFSFYTTRITGVTGHYDCNIQNVPTNDTVIFYVLTYDCQNYQHSQTVYSIHAQNVVDFVICDTNYTGCQASFQYYADSTNTNRFHFISTSTPANLIASLSWDFGDGSPHATTHDPWHTFATAGTYTVCLTITTTTNCTSTSCQTITAGQGGGCHAHFTHYTDSLNSAPYVCHFIDQSTGSPAHWLWNFGDPASGTQNTSTVQNPEHVYATSGTYMICLTISGNGCQDATCDTLFVGGGNPTNCENSFTYTKTFLTAHFEGHTNSPYFTYYSWNFGDPASGNNNVSTLQNPTHVFTTAGSFTITLNTVDSIGCIWNRTETIWLSGTCDLYGYVIALNSYIDHGLVQLIRVDSSNTMTVVDSKEVGDTAGMYWFGGVAPGHYYLKAELLPTSIYYGQYVPTYYEHSITWGDANLIELGQASNPYNIQMVPTIDLPAGNGNIQGTISQNLKYNGNGAPASNVEVLLINSQNQPFASTKTDVSGQFSFASIALGSYTIYPEYVGKSTIPAHITLDNANASATLSFNMNAGTIIFGINNDLPQFVTKISDIYPNPVSNKANLIISSTQDVVLMAKIIDLTGQTIDELSLTIHKGQNNVNISTAAYQDGFYYVKISSGNGGSLVKKFVKAGK